MPDMPEEPIADREPFGYLIGSDDNIPMPQTHKNIMPAIPIITIENNDEAFMNRFSYL